MIFKISVYDLHQNHLECLFEIIIWDPHPKHTESESPEINLRNKLPCGLHGYIIQIGGL